MTQTESPSKKKILDAAIKHMLAKGYGATTVDEICKTAGLTKGSFFHYFETKEDLGKAALKYFYGMMKEMMEKDGFLTQPDPLDRIYGYIDFTINLFKGDFSERSCLIGNIAQELSNTHEEIRKLCAGLLLEQSNMFKQFLDEAKIKYAPAGNIDTQNLSDSLLSLIQGSLVFTKAIRDDKLLERNLTHYKVCLERLFGG
ncbi:MAG: TetR family transcriptional regulator [bacterium]|nr:MAG: TetR family transcriptional regulator [bacterium]